MASLCKLNGMFSIQWYEFLERFVVPASDQRWLFPSPRGTRWDKDNFSQELKVINRAAGKRWACLDFRHTFGSPLAKRRVSAGIRHYCR